MLIPCYELRLLNTIIVLCSSANYVLLLLFPISCYLDSLNMAWKCSPCNLMANLGVTILTTKIVEFWSWSWSTLDWPYDHGNFRIMAMVMVNFEVTILTTKIVEFWHGHGQLWIDHMTMEIIELWPWSWSIFLTILTTYVDSGQMVKKSWSLYPPPNLANPTRRNKSKSMQSSSLSQTQTRFIRTRYQVLNDHGSN